MSHPEIFPPVGRARMGRMRRLADVSRLLGLRQAEYAKTPQGHPGQLEGIVHDFCHPCGFLCLMFLIVRACNYGEPSL